MAHPPEVREKCRSDYVFRGLPLNVVAHKNKVGEHTVRDWKRKAKRAGQDWDLQRSAVLLATRGAEDVVPEMLFSFYQLLNATMADLRTRTDVPPIEQAEAISRLADAFSKTMKSLRADAPVLNKLAVALEVLQTFEKWLRKHRPEQLGAWSDLIEPFGSHLTEVFGK